MQKKKARLRRDRNPNFVGEFKASAAFEMFLIQEYLNMPEKLPLIRDWKSPKDRDVARDNGFPCCRKWSGAQAVATPTLESSENHVGPVMREELKSPVKAEAADTIGLEVIPGISQLLS